jgi:lysophospholipase L1-like esterase
MIWRLIETLLVVGGLGCFALSTFVVTNATTRNALQLAFLRRIRWVVRPRFVIVGDSLAEQCEWSKLSSRPFSAVNLGTAGAGLKDIAGQVVRSWLIPGDWLLVNGGINDVLWDTASIDRLEEDFRWLLHRIGRRQKVIITLIPYVSDTAELPRVPPSDRTARIDEANRLIAQVSTERGFIVIDLNSEISSGGKRRPEMTNDGIHFSRRANSIWIKAVQRTVSASDLPVRQRGAVSQK